MKHTTLKNVALLKHFKISKTAPTLTTQNYQRDALNIIYS